MNTSRNAPPTGGQNESTSNDDRRTTEQILADAGIDFGTRAKVTRTGERAPISQVTRRLVYRRDRWTCQHCGAIPFTERESRRSGALHLDHIVPWSAGGSDRTDNLRTLCGKCNMARSNFVTGREKLSLPIVRICAPCLTMAGHKPADTFVVYCACRHHESWVIPGWSIL